MLAHLNFLIIKFLLSLWKKIFDGNQILGVGLLIVAALAAIILALM